MNFLAHIYLSGNNNDLMVGNFMGDFVKGNQYQNYTPEIQRGVLLHRNIDEYTDQHSIVTQSKDRIRGKYRHYSGVIIDVFYDHFLAANWHQYHPTPLDQFTSQVYRTITKYDTLPKGINYMLPYMIKGNWLLNYAKIEGIDKALSGMSRRTPYKSKMEEAASDLKKHYKALREDFETFFPELEQFCRQWLQDNPILPQT